MITAHDRRLLASAGNCTLPEIEALADRAETMEGQYALYRLAAVITRKERNRRERLMEEAERLGESAIAWDY